MKVFPFTIPKPQQEALLFQVDEGVSFYDKYHQHKEIQISVIVNGEGTLVVGDTVHKYQPNHVFVIGSHLPHVFKSEVAETPSLMLSFFFTETSFGDTFFQLQELQEVKSFFNRAKLGFMVADNSFELVHQFKQLQHKNSFEQFLGLLSILKQLANVKYKPLSTYQHPKIYTKNEGKRMERIIDFTMNNYLQTITLNDVAKQAAMTKNAFCKYFKKRTNKTYVTFVNQLRIEHACKLLARKPTVSIAEIAEQSGYQNISNFNRQFLASKEMSPREFRKNSIQKNLL